MKIKSVKITGFRAFEKEENSTFDFTKNGEIMNFASIYAPNGFGKTSFYDAVEWGITNKIQRFDRMVDFEKVRKDNDAPLLLNKASSSGRVIIETNSRTFENVINKKKVYKYNEKPVNEYFQNQILTQDLIDAFLKEEKADKRYENFLEIDENLKKYDSAYKKIIQLLKYIKDERKSLTNKKREEENKLQGEIDFEQEFKKFDELNDVIRSLNKYNENLTFIDQNTFSQTSYENLSRNTDIRLLSLEEELINAKLRIENIILARDGEESEDGKLDGGLLSYLDNKSKILKFDEQLSELNQVIKWFEDQEKTILEFAFNDENLKIQQNRLERALNIEKQFETFMKIQKEIDSLHKDIQDYKSNLIENVKEKRDAEEEKKDTISKLNELKNSLEINQYKINNLPLQQRQLELTSKKIDEFKNIIDELSNSIISEEKKLNDLNIVVDEFDYYENKINDDIKLLLEFQFYDKHKNLITHYISEEEKLDIFKRTLEKIQSKIDHQNKFNKELNDFINSGLELVNKSQSSDCPLCNHKYNSFEKLSENILTNKLLDSQLKILLEQKIEFESNINDLILKLADDRKNIQEKFSLIKQPFLLNQSNLKNAIDKFDSEKTSYEDKLYNSQSVLNEIILLLGDCKTFDELSSKIRNKIVKLDTEILYLSDRIKLCDEIIIRKEILIKSTKEKQDILESMLLKYQSSNEYREIKKYFIDELNSNEIEKIILSEVITNFQKNINDLIFKKENIIKSLYQLDSKLSNHTLSKDEYVKRTHRVNDAKKLIERIYDRYESLIKSEFSVSLSNKNKSQIDKEFTNLLETQKDLGRQITLKIEKFKIVKFLNEACIKATESKIIEDRIKEITETLRYFGKSELVLNAEREELKKYLKSTIESYFYTVLINAIYKKIDPHPDYRSIEFECDFADNKPRLQIYTLSITDEGEEVWSVPSLYFSTAQINILSLSIFLARALKTIDSSKNPVNCIFIDDPIQSMDSINILSFIDLFRGITLSLDKQLIVSTHEENFHLLLQKKIPSHLFKSKFIEFETFGVLKTN